MRACSETQESIECREILAIIKTLVAEGTDVSARDLYNSSPLMHASNYNCVHTIQCLLDFGAEINLQDVEGYTPLMTAISHCRDDSASYLLQRGALYTQTNKRGNTILHLSADLGTLRTIEILRATNLREIDPYAKNGDGKTPLELAQQRRPIIDGFIELFLILLFEIRNRNDDLARQCGVRSSPVVVGETCQSSDGIGSVDDVLEMPGAWPRN